MEKFRKLKKVAHGFVVKSPRGRLNYTTFVARNEKTHQGFNGCWRIFFLDPKNSKYTKDEMSIKIKRAVEKGWRVVPVKLNEVIELVE